MKPIERTKLDARAPFRVAGEDQGFRVGDFWRWSFSDLKQNALRCALAEFLVAQATGAAPAPQSSGWDDYDLITPDGITIEVKSSAFIQSWPQARPSEMSFSRLRGRAWDSARGRASDATCRADVFVFCIQTAKTHDEYDPLNVSQWEFYPVSGETISALGQKSLGLNTLRRLRPNPTRFEDLEQAVFACLDECERDDEDDHDRKPANWVTDITHFLDDGAPPDSLPEPARDLAQFLGSIISTVTRTPDKRAIEVRCRLGQGDPPCAGDVAAHVDNEQRIVWQCLTCDDNGLIYNWQDTLWDRSR